MGLKAQGIVSSFDQDWAADTEKKEKKKKVTRSHFFPEHHTSVQDVTPASESSAQWKYQAAGAFEWVSDSCQTNSRKDGKDVHFQSKY